MTTSLRPICTYTLFNGGNSNFMRSISIPLAEALESDLADDPSARLSNECPDFLDVDSRPTADAGIVIGGVVGLFVFFSSWLASKVLDDVYETKFQAAIRKALGAADHKLQGANTKKPKMFQVGIGYVDRNVFILVGIVGETFAEILDCEHWIKTVHDNAVLWIENNSCSEPILLYIVERGKVNLDPYLFDNLTLAHRFIGSVDVERNDELQENNQSRGDTDRLN